MSLITDDTRKRGRGSKHSLFCRTSFFNNPYKIYTGVEKEELVLEGIMLVLENIKLMFNASRYKLEEEGVHWVPMWHRHMRKNV